MIPSAPASLITGIRSRTTLPLTIVDGIGKLDPATIESTAGTVTSVTSIDLMSLSINSTWKLAPIIPPLPSLADQLPGWVAPPPKGPLPPVSIAYAGNIGDLAALTVNVDAADMQRELTVRQMERNVEELERLRRQDEYRAKVEQERRQAIEADRAAAKAAPAGQVLPPVLPESAGTTVLPDAQSSTGSTAPAGAADAPPAPGNGSAITPAGEPPAAANVKPQPVRVSPPRPPGSRRTSSDEVMRSLGGYP